MNRDLFHQFLKQKKTLVMGVLNVTPDSFSDGGVFYKAEVAVRHAAAMLHEGADIIDIGGQSTRPAGSAYGRGADRVGVDEELRRVLPVIDYVMMEHPKTIISIDTTKAEVARRALDSGATIINDVSGATEDPDMFRVAVDKQAPIILMHGYGPEFDRSSIDEYEYHDVVNEVFRWLRARVKLAKAAGIESILADVGFGFAKGAEDNVMLLRMHQKFVELGVPMLLGVSRKSTIGKILGAHSPDERVYGSISASVYGSLHGAKLIRTHDVRQTVEALRVADALRG